MVIPGSPGSMMGPSGMASTRGSWGQGATTGIWSLFGILLILIPLLFWGGSLTPIAWAAFGAALAGTVVCDPSKDRPMRSLGYAVPNAKSKPMRRGTSGSLRGGSELPPESK